MKIEDSDLYIALSPFSKIGLNPKLRIRLIHGNMDSTIDQSVSIEFNQILKEAGHDTKLLIINAEHSLPKSRGKK